MPHWVSASQSSGSIDCVPGQMQALFGGIQGWQLLSTVVERMGMQGCCGTTRILKRRVRRADLGHEAKEVVQEAGDVRLDVCEAVLIVGFHQVPQGHHRIHPHLQPGALFMPAHWCPPTDAGT